MPQLDVFDEAQFPQSLAWQAVAYMRQQWPSLFSDGLRWITRSAPPQQRPTHVVVHHEGVLVAYASVIELTVRHDRKDLALHGLGNVLTAAPYRRCGYGGQVVQRVNAWLDTAGGDVAGLFCAPERVGFYARYGWLECPGGTRAGTVAQPLAEVRMMRFLSSRGRAAQPGLLAQPLTVPNPW